MNTPQNHLFQKLQNTVQEALDIKILVVLDENFGGTDDIPLTLKNENVTTISNRYDVHQRLNQLECSNHFNDFDFSEIPNVDHIFYRISKERPVANHIIRNCLSVLSTDGTLFIYGTKKEGIKGYYDKIRKLQGVSGRIKKTGINYQISITNTDYDAANNELALKKLLDDKSYTVVREQLQTQLNDVDFTLFSKPGVFSWNRIDPASQYLCDKILPTLIDTLKTLGKTAKVLDLGCGHGQLSLCLAAAGFTEIYATDNNAASICAANITFQKNNLEVKLSADDCGIDLKNDFDIILCNPPFHQGFSTSNALIEKFALSTKRLLSKKGKAYFVCNHFIANEDILHDADMKIQRIDETAQFKILEIKHYF
jgi:16S rRNA (guanine1207-N2)-methyltransferase